MTHAEAKDIVLEYHGSNDLLAALEDIQEEMDSIEGFDGPPNVHIAHAQLMLGFQQMFFG